MRHSTVASATTTDSNFGELSFGTIQKKEKKKIRGMHAYDKIRMSGKERKEKVVHEIPSVT